jgi:hypothetical protein
MEEKEYCPKGPELLDNVSSPLVGSGPARKLKSVETFSHDKNFAEHPASTVPTSPGVNGQLSESLKELLALHEKLTNGHR